MEQCRWPGNVRELENAMERAVIVSRDEWVGVEDLLPSLTGVERKAPCRGESLPLGGQLQGFERRVIANTLRLHGGNRTKTARALGVNRTTLFKKMKSYGLFGNEEEA